MSTIRAILFGLVVLNTSIAAFADRKEAAMAQQITYRTVNIDGLNIAYREAGSPDAPTLLLLHGLPSSSRMFQPLLKRLANKYHMVAPDYPGFGHSDAPSPKQHAYTIDNIATMMYHITVKHVFMKESQTHVVGNVTKPEKKVSELWTDEYALLHMRGEEEIQSNLFYDYRTNVDDYPTRQQWMQKTQPKLLVIWGKYDLSFDSGEP